MWSKENYWWVVFLVVQAFNSLFFVCVLMLNMYGLLTKCEVKMAGYWPRSFFASLWTFTPSQSINMQKKELGQYPAILNSHLLNNPYIQTFQINYSTSANVKLTITILYITSASKTIVLLKTPPKCRKQTKKIKTSQKFTPTLTIFVAHVIMAHIQDG